MAALAGGAMNSIAGGGSFLTFPALIFVGVGPIVANATNNGAMWIGTIGSVRGYREEIAAHRHLLAPLALVSAVGAFFGAMLLLATPPALVLRLIPWLMLFATATFAVSPWLSRNAPAVARHSAWQFALQFFIAIYGGYFGAGMGILMLAVLAFSGLPSLNAANGIKNFLGAVINGVALVPFLFAHVVDFRIGIPLALAALAGGYFGARIARRIPPAIGRVIVIAIGATISAVFLRHYG